MYLGGKPFSIRLCFGFRICVALTIVLIGLAFNADHAYAESQRSMPSVLIVDSNLGDVELCKLHWIGDDAEAIAEEENRTLVTSKKPQWWKDGEAPETFMLACEGKPMVAEDLVWALDEIRESGAEPRVFIVAMGATGLPVRAYVQDAAVVKQSGRADVVGIAFLGAPHNGYSASEAYPECALWEKLADSIGISNSDLRPKSTYLESLNAGVFPRVLKNLVLTGNIGDLGFGATDGAGVTSDLTLPKEVCNQVESGYVNTTVSRSMNLTSMWQPFTSSIDYPDRKIDTKLVEQMSAMECYETSEDAQASVRRFYSGWFATNSVITHSSYAVLLDLSGSMNEKADDSGTKLDAARIAAKEYLHALSVRDELPLSAPVDVSVIGFSEAIATLASGYDKVAANAVDGAKASGETDIGLALDAAVEKLESSPTCATRRILLLSDGASTQGQSEKQIMAGAVSKAQQLDIAIDTIGFGDVGESNASFLEHISKATGGEYYLATDTSTLRVDFLKSYYSSLGAELVDEELSQEDASQATIVADEQTQAIELGVVFDGKTSAVQLLCDGKTLDQSLYTVSEQGGMTSLRCLNPAAGEYSVQISDAATPIHLFAVRQQGITSNIVAVSAEEDHSVLLVIAAASILMLAVVTVIVITKKSSKVNREATERSDV